MKEIACTLMCATLSRKANYNLTATILFLHIARDDLEIHLRLSPVSAE